MHQKKGKSFPTEVHFPLAYSSFLSLGTWLSMYLNILHTILQSHYLGQENSINFFLGSSKMLEQIHCVYAFMESKKSII